MLKPPGTAPTMGSLSLVVCIILSSDAVMKRMSKQVALHSCGKGCIRSHCRRPLHCFRLRLSRCQLPIVLPFFVIHLTPEVSNHIPFALCFKGNPYCNKKIKIVINSVKRRLP